MFLYYRILGIVFLIFGFITLVGSLIYCVVLCRENPYPRYPDDFYWTHHWSKTIGPSEIHYSTSEKPYRQNGHDRFNKYNGKYSDRESAKGYSDRESKLSRYWLWVVRGLMTLCGRIMFLGPFTVLYDESFFNLLRYFNILSSWKPFLHKINLYIK